MMENQQSGWFRRGPPRDDPINVPVTSTHGGLTSPYLNFDPAYIGAHTEGDFIFPEGAKSQRGRFEKSFSQIGGSVVVGAGVGGMNGIYSGIRETATSQLLGKVRRTQILNFVTKQGASSAQTLGVLALMYSGFGVITSWVRGVDDELNTVAASTLTGVLYKSSAGWKKCVRGGGIGLTVGALYCIWTSRDRLRDYTSS